MGKLYSVDLRERVVAAVETGGLSCHRAAAQLAWGSARRSTGCGPRRLDAADPHRCLRVRRGAWAGPPSRTLIRRSWNCWISPSRRPRAECIDGNQPKRPSHRSALWRETLPPRGSLPNGSADRASGESQLPASGVASLCILRAGAGHP